MSALIDSGLTGQEGLGVVGLVGGDLNFDAAHGEGVAIHAQGGELVLDEGVKFGGFEAGVERKHLAQSS